MIYVVIYSEITPRQLIVYFCGPEVKDKERAKGTLFALRRARKKEIELTLEHRKSLKSKKKENR